METAMPGPAPSAIRGFHAGKQNLGHVKYPHLPKAIPVHGRHVSFPRLMSTGHSAPKTKLPMGMTLPIMTKMGGHPMDTASRLPMCGTSTC
jgi:hypothetical protein